MQAEPRAQTVIKGIAAVAADSPGADIPTGMFAALQHQVPVPVQLLLAAEQAGAEGVPLLPADAAPEVALVHVPGEGIEIHAAPPGATQAGTTAEQAGAVVAAVIEVVSVVEDRSQGQQVHLVLAGRGQAQYCAVEGLTDVRLLADIEQRALAVLDLLTTDAGGRLQPAEVEAGVDEGLGHIVAAAVAGQGELLIP